MPWRSSRSPTIPQMPLCRSFAERMDQHEVYPLGLSDKYGLVNLYGASGTGASLLSGWAAYSSRFRQTISVTTLDTLLGNRFDGKQHLGSR